MCRQGTNHEWFLYLNHLKVLAKWRLALLKGHFANGEQNWKQYGGCEETI